MFRFAPVQYSICKTKIIKKLSRNLSTLQPYQVIILGFLFYASVGVLLISMPFAQKQSVGIIDNLFNVVSAMSTTGLTTGAISELYTPFGKLILLGLIQLGAIGYMTITSFFILSSGSRLPVNRIKSFLRNFHCRKALTLSNLLSISLSIHL